MKHQKSKKVGLPPGSIIFTGQRKVDRINIHYLQYNETKCDAQILDNQSITEFHQPNDQYVQWYDIRGVHDTELIAEIGKIFSVHPLALEDIANTYERPKLDEFKDGIFITIKALSFDALTQTIQSEQVALYLGNGYVLSFQEAADDLFLSVRNRIERSSGRIRKRGASYLLYTLL